MTWLDNARRFIARETADLPPDAPLVNVVGWCQAHRDNVAVLLLQHCG